LLYSKTTKLDSQQVNLNKHGLSVVKSQRQSQKGNDITVSHIAAVLSE